MKKFILSLAVLFSCFASFGQREIISMNWDVVKDIVKETPDDVKELVIRLSAPTLDTTLTYNDRIIAFYGQSLLSNGKEAALVDDMSKLYSQKDYVNALGKAREALAINPLNLRALDRAGMCIALLIESGDTSYSKDEAKQYFNRAMRIYNTIAMTGLGDEEYPFCVTSVADEYEFMRNYLELYEYESQALVGFCDVFTLKETSEYYSDKKIYFDATRPLEMLGKALGL
jgi:tetratricopeptide (TPR) repeat protein